VNQTTKAADLQDFPSCLRIRLLPVCCPRLWSLCLARQHNRPICRANVETGATGLEPATSGVTGRAGACDGRRRPAAEGAGYGALLDGAGAAIAGRLDALEAKLEEQAQEAGV